MDGTKEATETLNPERDIVGRCSVGAEAHLKIWVDPAETRILSKVTAKFGENPNHLKG
jgi:hypothetical protein